MSTNITAYTGDYSQMLMNAPPLVPDCCQVKCASIIDSRYEMATVTAYSGMSYADGSMLLNRSYAVGAETHGHVATKCFVNGISDHGSCAVAHAHNGATYEIPKLCLTGDALTTQVLHHPPYVPQTNCLTNQRLTTCSKAMVMNRGSPTSTTNTNQLSKDTPIKKQSLKKPPKRQTVVDRLRKRIDDFRKRHGDSQLRLDATIPSHVTNTLACNQRPNQVINSVPSSTNSLNLPSEFQVTISLSKNSGDVSTTAQWTVFDNKGVEFSLNQNTSLLFEHLHTISTQNDSTITTRLPEMGRDFCINFKGMKMSDAKTGEEYALFRKASISDVIQPLAGGGLSAFPPLWSPQTNDIELVTLSESTTEFIAIKHNFFRTLPDVDILAIQRVQNKKLYIRYAFQKAMLLDKNSGNESNLNEKLLFHGTKGTPPSTIWESEDGFDLRYCKSGMWGIGIYFAENASYSHNYAHRVTSQCPDLNVREMLVANVLTGNAKEMKSKSSLTRPPVYLPATTTHPEILYDSVTGFTGGSRVYILYKLDMAYPSYVIKYLTKKGL